MYSSDTSMSMLKNPRNLLVKKGWKIRINNILKSEPQYLGKLHSQKITEHGRTQDVWLELSLCYKIESTFAVNMRNKDRSTSLETKGWAVAKQTLAILVMA